MITKTEQIRQHVRNQEWKKALSIVSKFRNYDKENGKIFGQAYQAYTNPRFTVQIGLDVDATIQKGIDLLKELY